MLILSVNNSESIYGRKFFVTFSCRYLTKYSCLKCRSMKMQNFHFHLSGISSDQDLLHTLYPLLFGWPPQKQAPMFRIYVVNHHSKEAVAKKLGQNFEKILEKKNTIETLKICFFQEGIPLNQWNLKYSYKLINDMFF